MTTRIEWAEDVWNVMLGCAKVSAGCAGCYAIRDAYRLAHNPDPKIAGAYAGLTERRSGKTNWTGRVRFLPERLDKPLRRRKPTRWFVNSMSDLFHDDVADDQLDRVFAAMALAPRHDFLILSKRPERMRDYLTETWQAAPGGSVEIGSCTVSVPPESAGDRREHRIRAAAFEVADAGEERWSTPDGGLRWPGWPLPNVWLGVSIEDQATAEARLPLLLETPAALRWVSYEPALGPVDLRDVTYQGVDLHDVTFQDRAPAQLDCLSFAGEALEDDPRFRGAAVDWVVCGGESGPDARPMHADWARAMRDQCAAAGVPFFFKQWGDWHPCVLDAPGDERGSMIYPHDESIDLGEQGFRVQRHGDPVAQGQEFARLGKRLAGRTLDGAIHDALPDLREIRP